MRNHTAKWLSMNLSKQPARLKLTSMSGEQTFNEVTITGSTGGKKNYYLIDTGTIISWVLRSLLNNIYVSNSLTKIHVFMYLKDIIRGVNTNDGWSYRFKLDYQIDNREKIVNFREVRGA